VPYFFGGVLVDLLKLVICLAITFLAAFLGSIATGPAIPTWYASLAKPSFNPPNWIFGPVWTVLYILMAVSAYLVWQKGLSDSSVRIALALFVVQLVLNALWSILFFGLWQPLAGFIDIAALWVALLFTILNFLKISAVAGWLLIPYILWVSFAAILNLCIFALNR
jgi:tryptophan-rich sensory protein